MNPATLKRPGSLVIEPRDGDDVVELAVAFTVEDGPSSWAGERLSRRHLLVRATQVGPVGVSDEVRPVNVLVPLGGYDLRLPMRARLRPLPHASGLLCFDIVAMDQPVEAALGQVFRSLLVGYLPDAQDLARGWDEETPQRPPSAAVSRKSSWLVLLAGLLLMGLALWALCYQGFVMLTQVRSRTAAVSAQRIDLVSPEYGVVGEDAHIAGARVAPGDVVATIRSAQLEAALAEADAAAPEPGDLRQAGLHRALERRLESLTFRAKCLCAVLWSATPGTNVAPGALVASLVVTDPAQVRVEALVQAATASALEAGQGGTISWASNPAGIAATVESVRFDTAPIARVGLGSDRAQSATVILKADDPTLLPPAGTPVNVLIYK